MGRLIAVILAMTIALAAGAAYATQAGQGAIKNWSLMDQCAREAQAAYPDYSAADYAKRDAKLKECLEEKNLPPRDPLAPGH